MESPASADTSLELTIVMPCLNEAETLAGCVEEALRALREQNISGEVIVADNGSTDGSQEIATRLGARVIPVSERGYGRALQGGIAAARGRFVLMGDSDGSYDFTHASRFVEKLRSGYDLVMGNRFRGGIQPGAMPWKNRYLGNPLLSGIGRLFFRCPIRDFHCGLRAFSRDAYHRLELRTAGMEFASEMVIKATLFALRITEIPTTLRPDGRSRPPHLRPWRDGWRHLRFMLLFSPRWLFLQPGLALFFGGLLVSALLVRGPLRIGAITFDVHTLIFAAMAVLIGFQAATFAVFTKIFAINSGLLPADPRLERPLRWLNLERGLALGAVLALSGLVLSFNAVGVWSGHAFGNLAPGELLRLVIPGSVFLTLGCQIILMSFLLSILDLPLRR